MCYLWFSGHIMCLCGGIRLLLLPTAEQLAGCANKLARSSAHYLLNEVEGAEAL